MILKELRITPDGIKEFDKVKVTIERLQTFEPPEGYHVAFSGGKDSVVIKELCIMAGVKFDAHYNLTTLDPPELVQFIREYHKDVAVHKPKKTMWQLISEKGLPTRTKRWCCDVLKEEAGIGRIVVTGVRWEESYKRSKRRVIEQCNKHANKTYLNPIIDWTEQDIWEFIKTYNIPYCKLYDEGWKRIGCIGCPMADKKRIKEFERYPTYYRNYMRAIEKFIPKYLKNKEEKGEIPQFTTAEQMMDWWLNGKHEEDSDQTIMFE